MDAKIKADWVDALRSGKYQQAHAVLHNAETNSYCCLGVLCKVLGAEFIKADNDGFVVDNAPVLGGIILSESDEELLTSTLCEKLGIPDQVALMNLNDGIGFGHDEPNYLRRHTFLEIADYIESNL